MPRVRPLRPDEARRSLAHRLGPRIDRLRQISTRFGERPYRVFLVWTRSQGAESSRGDESVIARVEILPTPRVSDVTALSRRPWTVGVLPEGTLRVDRVSVLYTFDQLSGLVIPDASPPRPGPARGEQVSEGSALTPTNNAQVAFFYEMVEDGRGDSPAGRERFRLFSKPSRDAGAVSWSLLLEPQSEPTDRSGSPLTSENDVRFDDDAEPR